MKREIKFRGKSIISGDWIYGCLFVNDDKRTFIVHELITKDTYYSEVIPESIGQSTGIKDRNGTGVEVFEGDKIGRTSFWDKEIVWDKCGFYTISVNNPERKFPLTNLDEFDVVIGNVHENKEPI